MRDGYVARWQGREYEASPDGDDVRLYRPSPARASTEVRPGRYVRVRAGRPRSRTSPTSAPPAPGRGSRSSCSAEHDGWLRVEYTGGRWPVAEALGLEVFDFGVYQGWAPAAEVTDLREQRV